MLNDGNDPHLALWLANIADGNADARRPRLVLFVVAVMMFLSVALVVAWHAS